MATLSHAAEPCLETAFTTSINVVEFNAAVNGNYSHVEAEMKENNIDELNLQMNISSHIFNCSSHMGGDSSRQGAPQADLPPPSLSLSSISWFTKSDSAHHFASKH